MTCRSLTGSLTDHVSDWRLFERGWQKLRTLLLCLGVVPLLGCGLSQEEKAQRVVTFYLQDTLASEVHDMHPCASGEMSYGEVFHSRLGSSTARFPVVTQEYRAFFPAAAQPLTLGIQDQKLFNKLRAYCHGKGPQIIATTYLEEKARTDDATLREGLMRNGELANDIAIGNQSVF